MCVFVCRYFKSHTLLVEQRIEKDKLSEVVRESDAALRYLFLHPHSPGHSELYRVNADYCLRRFQLCL